MSRSWGRRLLWVSIFAAVSVLILGGLGWATFWSLRLENDQYHAAAESEHLERVSLALWRLDGRVNPTLAREDSRPFTHYAALHPPVGAIGNDGRPWSAGMVWLPSPLLSAELPDWVRLHFQVDAVNGWQSPRVVSDRLTSIINSEPGLDPIPSDEEARAVLDDLRQRFEPAEFIRLVGPLGIEGQSAPIPDPFDQMAQMPAQQRAQWTMFPNAGQSAQSPDLTSEYNRRSQTTQRGFAESKESFGNNSKNYMGRDNRIPSPHGGFPGGTRTVEVHLGPLTPKWFRDEPSGPPMLVLVRKVSVDQAPTYQGVLLDWPKLQTALLAEVADLFPAAGLEPAPNAAVNAGTGRLMSSLPVRLDPGPTPHPPPLRWTPLRVGLAAGWVAALIALSAVGFAGRSLMALSDRRMRFASAVTHELRTPLTTLRLYVDMLVGGLVRDERQRQEYFATLRAESDRLQRLIENLLDFSALEKRRPSVSLGPVEVAEVFARLEDVWAPTYQAAGKALVVEPAEPGLRVISDFDCLTQLLGTLLDNAQKHTRGADDDRVWLRAVPWKDGAVAFEVEDRGETGAVIDRRVFRDFRQGNGRPTTGGVGLGLALARRWAKLIAGRLTAHTAEGGVGACFRLVAPAAQAPSTVSGSSSS